MMNIAAGDVPGIEATAARIPAPISGLALDKYCRGGRQTARQACAPGVQEIRIAYSKEAYRVIYVARLADRIYVLHAFHKKAKKGIATPKEELDLREQALQRARESAAQEVIR